MLKKCLVFLCVFVLSTSLTFAQQGSLSLSPASIESLNVGDALEFSLNITGSDAVSAYQATIEFDTSALRYTSSENGDYLAAGAYFVPPKVQGNLLKLAAASGSESQGAGTVAIVTFEVIAVKASTLTLSDALFSNTQGQTAPPQQITDAEITEPPAVSIPDAALADAIRRALNLDQGGLIIAEAIATVTQLNASDMEISDLTGLEHATNLQSLTLSDNQISDITSLATLTNLQILNLSANKLIDVKPLSGLTNLQSLTLSDNQISDITPLATLTNLQSLTLIANQISDVAPLVVLENLQLLFISRNPLEDTTPLASLTKPIIDVPIAKPMEVSVPDAALAGAIRSELSLEAEAPITETAIQTLTQLNASDMEISDLTGLEQATNLQTLELENNQINDITPLIALVNLQFLFLSGNQISDVTPLIVLVNLETLHLNGNPLEDTSPLAELTNLTDVDVEITEPSVSDGTDVDVEITEPSVAVPDAALAGAIRSELGLETEAPITETALQTLTQLNASDMEISDLTGLEHATNLQTLELENNQINDITPLIVLVNLQFLFLSGNQISDVTPLIVLVNLETLHLEGNPVEDTSPLTALTNLTDVDVEITEPSVSDGTDVDVEITEPVVSVPDTALAEAIRSELSLEAEAPITETAMQTLTQLNASDMEISDLTGLEQATNLQVLELENNQISDITPLAELTNLQVLDLQNNQITDLEPLAELTNLENLQLQENPVEDTSPLANLTNLTDLDVEITEPLASVPDAALAGAIRSELGLEAEAPITETALQTLTQLNASDIEISDLTGLEQATNLQVIELQNNQINDVTPLSTLTNLQTLNLVGNQINDVTPLVALVNLQTLHLEGNPVEDTSPLTALTNLTDVDVEITTSKLPEDVNKDKVVDILDLTFVGIHFGKTGAHAADVNGDEVVDISDLVLTAGKLGTTIAAPRLRSHVLETFTTAEVQGWLAQAQHLDITDATSRNGILFLEQLLAVLTPEKTVLLANYPNPFNPETWIPYHLAAATEVQITIYDPTGKVVRRLDLGHQPAGYYTDRSQAAYWDGRNALGESVASGVYFYQLETAQVSLLRKLVVLK